MVIATIGSNAQAKPSDPCRAPIPIGRTIDVRQVRLHEQTLNTDQHQIDGCVATRNASVEDVSIFYIVLEGSHTPVSEDGKAVLLSPGPGMRVGPSYGTPHIPKGLDGLWPWTIAVAQWKDSAGDHVDAFAVHYCVIPDDPTKPARPNACPTQMSSR